MFSLRKWKIPFYKQQDGPPDLDAIARKLRADFLRLLKIKNQSTSKKEGGNNASGKVGISIVVILTLVVWALSGIFIVSPSERAVILRFGKYVKTVGAGPHWIPRFISSHYTLTVRTTMLPYQAEMLTKDENIVSVSLAIQYRIDSLEDFLFNVVNPVESLQQATASALRQVVGQTTLDEILTVGRAKARDEISEQIKKTLSIYQPGLLVTDVTLQPAKPPEQVTEAFNDAIKAREDEQRYINQAQAYAKKQTAIAQGQAARILQEANAYKQKVILGSEAHTAAFLALLPEYKKAPSITRERMYLDTVEFMLANSSKILVDTKGGNQMFYLPLDKLFSKNILNTKHDQIGNNTRAMDSTDAGIVGNDPISARFQSRASYNLNDNGVDNDTSN